jgi:hypothetical protein
MKRAFIYSIILLGTFVISFLVTTALFDTFEKYTDYYSENISEISEVDK